MNGAAGAAADIIGYRRGYRRRCMTEVVSMEAKFKCQDCERMFDTRAGLWYHTKCKHESVRNACNQCDKQFTHQGHVVTHIQSIHT